MGFSPCDGILKINVPTRRLISFLPKQGLCPSLNCYGKTFGDQSAAMTEWLRSLTLVHRTCVQTSASISHRMILDKSLTTTLSRFIHPITN